MSHYTHGIIIPKNIFEEGELAINIYIKSKMEKYDENIEVDPYIQKHKSSAKEMLEKEIKEFEEIVADPRFKERREENQKWCKNKLDLLRKMTPEEFWGRETEYDDNFDEEGNVLTTYNPNSKWDWYRIGGRWDGEFVDNYQSSQNGFNFGDQHTTISNNSQTIKEYKERLKKNPETYGMFSYIDLEGNWLERGEMLMFGVVADEKEEKSYEEEVLNFIEKQKEENYIINLDCHI